MVLKLNKINVMLYILRKEIDFLIGSSFEIVRLIYYNDVLYDIVDRNDYAD